MNRTRNDGKARRQPMLGLRPTTHNGLVGDAVKSAPSWHELVQPGAKGDIAKRLKRAQAVHHGVLVVDNGSVVPRAQRRASHARGWNGGFLSSSIARPARAAGVALASPRSIRGRAQRPVGE